MSKQEEVNYLQIQTCVLKVNIHCDGCKQQVKKLLQRIDGVYTTMIDAEQGKVTVSGNVDPSTLIKKLGKSGKHAEIWGSKPSNNQPQKMQNEKGKKGQKDGKSQEGQQQQQPQMKGGFKDLKLPQLKDLKSPFKEQKTVKFKSPEYDDVSDDDHDEFDEFYDDVDEEFYDDDDSFDDEHAELLKLMNDHGINGKKGGADLDVQNKGMGANNEGKIGNGGKKGGGNQNQGGGGAKTADKKGSNGGNNKNATNVSGGNNNEIESKKGAKSNVGHGLNGMHVTNGSGFGGLNSDQMGNIPAVQGLPAMNAGAYFQGAGPAIPSGNPYYQQYAAAMMNHQGPIEIERFQPMGYARSTPATAYYAPPYPPPYNHPFADENPSGCSVM